MDSFENKRIKILSDSEVKDLYNLPNFTFDEQQEFFSLSESEETLLNLLISTKSKLYFVLQLGYFKSMYRFYKFNLDEVKDDANYVLKYILNAKINNYKSIDKKTRLKQQKFILKHFNYRKCTNDDRQIVQEKASKAVMISCKPIYIFREMIDYLSNKRIIIPKYSFFQNVIGAVITNEQKRLVEVLKKQLNDIDIRLLKKLLKDSDGLHEITKIKREPKDFTLKEMKSEIDRGAKLNVLYKLSKTIMPKLNISNESVKHYSSLVTYYSVYSLKRFDKWIVFIYLICFTFNRCQQVNDNLIDGLIYKVRQYIDLSKESAKEKIYEYLIENNTIDMKKAGKVLKIFTDDTFKADTPFYQIQKVAFDILERKKLEVIANNISTNKGFDETVFEWKYIDILAQQFKIQLRPLLLRVNFTSSLVNQPLIEAINFIKKAIVENKSLNQYPLNSFPNKFIPKSAKKYIYKNNDLLVDRYEFLIYKELRKALESGAIFCNSSTKYRSLEDDLIDDKQWANKEKLMQDNNLTKLNQSIEKHLDELEELLERRICEVNQNINSGENKFFKIINRGKSNRWTLKYVSDPNIKRYSFFNELKSIDIKDILSFVNDKCGYTAAFEHILGRYSKQNLDLNVLIACIIAWGTNMGIIRMGEISDINYQNLSTVSSNFIRLESLEKANDIICNAISKLSIFKNFNIGGLLHSSSDGQKKEMFHNTFNSRHSPKYFGLGKGVVEYNLIINNIPVNAKIIGANDHESHYVYDILYGNNTEIKPDIHSTDTHGANEVNFAILSFFGYQFAPRYKDIYNVVTESLYGFENPSFYNGIIKPVRKINRSLIVSEWENIKRIVLSLALKTTTQNTIIRKLSSHNRKNRTKRALWEYDNIIKSLYLLDYIDSLKLRQNIQKALNRGESYHKLKKAISYANFGKLRYRTEYEQQMWSQCSRLIANCIIYYNTTILSKIFKNNKKNNHVLKALRKISPIVWQHINFFGRFKFNQPYKKVDIDKIIEEIKSYDMTANENILQF